MITQSELKHFLFYNKDNGVFIWKNPLGKRIKIGCVAGHIHSTGYVKIIINGKLYRAHRLAWLYIHGKFPDDQIDHINHIKNDNRISNLRCVTQLDNNKNKSISKRNKTGITGISWNNQNKKWAAQIVGNGINIVLGYFTNIDDAIKARNEAEIKYGYHKNHGLENKKGLTV